jgi:hypothetical protein
MEVEESVVAGAPVVGSDIRDAPDDDVPGKNSVWSPIGNVDEVVAALRSACPQLLFRDGRMDAETLTA